MNTGRWTAPDLIGDRGGDPDWYGYCLDDPVNGVDPLGLFRFGKRALNGLPWLGGVSNSPGGYLDTNNVELSHEHGFYEDGSGKNIGFGNTGIMENEDVSDYHLEDKYYDDKRMRRSQKITPKGDYDYNDNNCQDYADRLRQRYGLLNRADKMR